MRRRRSDRYSVGSEPFANGRHINRLHRLIRPAGEPPPNRCSSWLGSRTRGFPRSAPVQSISRVLPRPRAASDSRGHLGRATLFAMHHFDQQAILGLAGHNRPPLIAADFPALLGIQSQRSLLLLRHGRLGSVPPRSGGFSLQRRSKPLVGARRFPVATCKQNHAASEVPMRSARMCIEK